MKAKIDLKLAYLAAGSLLFSTFQGCEPILLVGAGAAVGKSAAQEGGLGQAVADTEIKTKILAKWLDEDQKIFSGLAVKVEEGKVLLTGRVPTAAHHVKAIRIVWRVEGVKEVVDQVTVGEKGGVGDFVRDSRITSQLKIKLLSDPDIQSINYSIATAGGKVYIMGIAQHQQELNKVLQHARAIKDVVQVVNLAESKGAKSTTP